MSSVDDSTQREPQEDFLQSCKAWEKWLNAKQRDGQSVLQFADYLQKVATLLPRHELGEPSVNERFHRLRSSLRQPIKAKLDAQINQPTTYDGLVKIASWIEEEEMNTLGRIKLSRRRPLDFVPPKFAKQTPSRYRPDPSHNGYTSVQRARLALDHAVKDPGPIPSKVSKRSRRKPLDSRIPRRHSLDVDQISIADKNGTTHGSIHGKPSHTTSECHEGASKSFGTLSFPVRSKVLENSENI
ncbi:hypothetical protein MMC07_007622 [Pseudocyphellaria aurata]|nr:hypothetical protein [Pseudocyphellaria aurata]